MEESEYTSFIRRALVVWALANGEGVKTRDVMRMTGLSKRGAQAFLRNLSTGLPIYRDEDDVWQRCEIREISA